MRDLLNKLTLFESTQEGFDPETFDFDFQFDAIGDDGEQTTCTVSATANIEEGKPVVDPKSLSIDCPMDGNSKLGFDADIDLEMQDMDDMMNVAQEEADEQWAERDNKYSQGENVGEDADDEVSDEMKGQINQWIKKYSKYEGGYGTMPKGYVKWALDSGIATDFIEENEAEAMEEKYGEDFNYDPFALKFYNQMPITKACMEDLEKITGDSDSDHNARIIDAVMNGERFGESTNEDGMARGIGTLDKFRELYRKGIGSDDDEVVLRELIEVINDDALFADEFPELKAFTSASEFDDSEIVTAKDVPGDTADEKIESLIKAIDDDEWVESFVITLMKDFNIDGGENEELDRIKELSGLDTNEEDEQTFEGEEFYEYYGYLPWHEDIVDEAEYQGRKVKLGKPMQGDVKKFKVYVRDPKTKNIKKVNFGDPNMRIKKSNPKRRKSFRARHNCANPGPRTKARYWSCRKW